MPKKSSPKYLFDLHAVIKALSGGNNLVRSAFISGLESGEVLIQRSVSKELKDVDEDVYKDFQLVNPGRVYQSEGAKHASVQQALQQKYGTNFWGNSPRPSCFLSVAMSTCEDLILVTDGRPLSDCRKIVKDCSLATKVFSLPDFAAAV
ncbi:hypothetical protein [Pseudorhodobacter antarcticus]|uniref:hypothetical protein n=1 Tax=Pseudorhodobacter antarcticus TaxID=1077947 RepID=UPI00067DFA4C|nr:hypothetical protein [Pseudorhodobacter antarcticus]